MLYNRQKSRTASTTNYIGMDGCTRPFVGELHVLSVCGYCVRVCDVCACAPCVRTCGHACVGSVRVRAASVPGCIVVGVCLLVCVHIHHARENCNCTRTHDKPPRPEPSTVNNCTRMLTTHSPGASSPLEDHALHACARSINRPPGTGFLGTTHACAHAFSPSAALS